MAPVSPESALLSAHLIVAQVAVCGIAATSLWSISHLLFLPSVAALEGCRRWARMASLAAIAAGALAARGYVHPHVVLGVALAAADGWLVVAVWGRASLPRAEARRAARRRSVS
jgi:hypothetical protein